MPGRHIGTLAAGLAAVAVLGLPLGPAVPALDAQTPVTFSEHVAPIVFANCTSCHRPGEAAPFSLLGYKDARPLAKAIAAATASRAMPPWKAGPGDYAFANERRLTPEQIRTIEGWVADGALEGDPAKLPPLPAFTEGWQLGRPDLVVSMSEPFEVPATGPDVYRSFVVPLNLDRDVWVRAVDFRPSARAVVHHSLFFLDSTGAARERDEEDAGPGFSGGMGGVAGLGGRRNRVAGLLGGRGAGRGAGRAAGAATPSAIEQVATGAGGLGGWALGGRAVELPDGLAFFVPKGADLILSTHFHPSGTVQREQSTIGLYFAASPPTQAFTGIQLPPIFGVLEGLDIPAGESRYTIADSFVLPIDVKAFGVGAHAHYLGKEMTLTATLPDGTPKSLLSIPDWDFAWQERYRYRDFVALPRGTRIHAAVTFDNSAANRRNPNRPPVRVTWGEESNDEMGSITLQVIAERPGELPQLQRALAEHTRNAALSRPGLAQLLRRRR
jgi:mono/diheme cytochrome c family protein